MSKRRKKKSKEITTTATYWKPKVTIDYEAKYAGHPRLYAAYGSNLNVLQMQVRCATAEPVTHGELIDYELVFTNVATIEPKPGARCPIAVWHLEAEDIDALDKYEGYPTLYRKLQVKMTILGKEEELFTYIMNPPYDIEPPWNSYFETVEEGYTEWGLDLSVLDKAVQHAHDHWTIPGVTTLRGKSDTSLAWMHEADAVDEWDECAICGDWDPIRLMTGYTEDGVHRYLCSTCTFYADHVEDNDLIEGTPWWMESKLIAGSEDMDADDPGDQDIAATNWNDPWEAGYYDPRELDYNGSIWDERYQRPNYPLAY